MGKQPIRHITTQPRRQRRILMVALGQLTPQESLGMSRAARLAAAKNSTTTLFQDPPWQPSLFTLPLSRLSFTIAWVVWRLMLILQSSTRKVASPSQAFTVLVRWLEAYMV